MKMGVQKLWDTHFPMQHFGYNNIGKTFFLRPEEALTEFRQKLVFLTKIGCVCEKINLLHYN